MPNVQAYRVHPKTPANKIADEVDNIVGQIGRATALLKLEVDDMLDDIKQLEDVIREAHAAIDDIAKTYGLPVPRDGDPAARLRALKDTMVRASRKG